MKSTSPLAIWINNGSFTRGAFVMLFVCLFIADLSAQQQLKLSDAHLNKIVDQTNQVKKLKMYRRYFKRDSNRYVKQLNRYWKDQYDSMQDAIVDDENKTSKKTKSLSRKLISKVRDINHKSKNRNEQFLLANGDMNERFSKEVLKLLNSLSHYYQSKDSGQTDTIGWSKYQALKGRIRILDVHNQQVDKISNISSPIKTIENSTQRLLNSNRLSATDLNLKGDTEKYNTQMQSYQGEYGSLVKVNVSGNDFGKQLESRASGINEIKGLQRETGEIQGLKNIPSGYKAQVEQLTDSAQIKQLAKKKAEDLAMDYLNSNPELLKSARAKMNLLMKKYSFVSNSNDLSTAVKRSSLKGRTFKERLVIAANFQVLTIDPVSIDFSPLIGYRFNRKLTTGIGGTYRQTFHDSIPKLAPQVFGYKAFGSYEVINSFFAYLEYGGNSPGLKKDEGKSTRIWKYVFLAGVGKKITIHPKVEMTLVFAYNFLYKPNDPIYPRPWVVRVGFQTSDLAMLKRKK
ncbi:MAG TPA: hypothetical protein VL443_21150 [Cyclobacteriaceae bacterium]|nr:hypothetical protein [Cyclobacteriaceae bacterium]